MSRKAWFPLYVADYLAATRGLTTLEHGAYLLILMELYEHDGVIRSDPEYLRRVTRLSKHLFAKTWPNIEEFFEKNNEKITQKRVTKQLKRQDEIGAQATEKASKASRARWRPATIPSTEF